jgi:hypothetical protein
MAVCARTMRCPRSGQLLVRSKNKCPYRKQASIILLSSLLFRPPCEFPYSELARIYILVTNVSVRWPTPASPASPPAASRQSTCCSLFLLCNTYYGTIGMYAPNVPAKYVQMTANPTGPVDLHRTRTVGCFLYLLQIISGSTSESYRFHFEPSYT